MKLAVYIISMASLYLLHAGHTAEYTYSLEDKHIQMKFSIDKDEFLMFNEDNNCNTASMTAFCAARYLNAKTVLLINGEAIKFELHNSYSQEEHLVVNLRSVDTLSIVDNIEIHNNCFFEIYPNYRNRVILDFENFQKSYVLTQGNESVFLP